MDPGAALRGDAAPAGAAPVLTFLDTNVVVYAYDRSEPRKRDIARSILADQPQAIVLSTQVLAEFYWTSTRKLARPLPKQVAAEVVRLMSRYRVVGADARFVQAAIELAHEHQLALWDGLILRAAQVAGCGRLLTEDLHHGARYGGVVVENPFR